MPILQAPAHNFDTLNTVVKRCIHISDSPGQHYTVIMFCKLVELKWAIPEYQLKLVILLMGLQISTCFLNVTGDLMNEAGLLWSKHGSRLDFLSLMQPSKY